VIAYTNCQYVSLYLNDRLISTKGYHECPRFGATKSWLDGREKNPTTNDLHLSWDVPYEPGILRAEGYMDGKLVIEKSVETTGVPARMVAEAWSALIRPGEIAQIELHMEDEKGRPVPDAEPMIECEVSGAGEYLGMDGGNLLDLSLYREKKRKMFAGALLCEVRGTEPGIITVCFQTEQNIRTKILIEVAETGE